MDIALFEAIIDEALAGCDRFPVLRTLFALRRRDLVATDDDLDFLARRFGRPIGDVRRIHGFVGALVTPPEGCRSIRFCKSVSCTANGCEALHTQVAHVMQALRSPLAIENVYCLEQCDSGPSLAIGVDIWVGSEERIVSDCRSWHAGS